MGNRLVTSENMPAIKPWSIDAPNRRHNDQRHYRVQSFFTSQGINDPLVQKQIMQLWGNHMKQKRSTRCACDNWNRFKKFVLSINVNTLNHAK